MRKVIIVGGVAAGMSAASKAKREKKDLEITVYEMTDIISWGSCGLPYYVGNFYDDSKRMIAKPLEQFKKDRNLDLVSAGVTYIAPLGLYSKKYKSVEELPDKATIAIPNDPTNSGRALLLFHRIGLIKLKDPTDLHATAFDIVENPKKIKFRQLEAAQLPRVIDDVDAAIINGGYALNAGFYPTKDSILLEDKDSPYINIIAVRAGDENREDIKTFVKCFQSEKVRNYINETFKGGFVPVF